MDSKFHVGQIVYADMGGYFEKRLITRVKNVPPFIRYETINLDPPEYLPLTTFQSFHIMSDFVQWELFETELEMIQRAIEIEKDNRKRVNARIQQLRRREKKLSNETLR